MHLVDVIIHQLMSKPRTWLYILHLSPVLLTYVLILVHTRPEKWQHHKIALIVTRYSLQSLEGS